MWEDGLGEEVAAVSDDAGHLLTLALSSHAEERARAAASVAQAPVNRGALRSPGVGFPHVRAGSGARC
jgi:hypothetical protein